MCDVAEDRFNNPKKCIHEKACDPQHVFEQRETHMEGEVQKTAKTFLKAQYLSNTGATLIMAGFHLVRAIVALPGPRHCACWLTDTAYWHR